MPYKDPETARRRKRELYDPAKERLRRAAKREWENAWQRSPAGRGVCADCGGPRGIGAMRHAAEGRCEKCWRKSTHDRRVRMEAMWAKGLLVKEIAAEFGMSMGRLASEMHRARDAGYELPKRPPGGLR